mgnify:CR=1 FL=1
MTAIESKLTPAETNALNPAETEELAADEKKTERLLRMNAKERAQAGYPSSSWVETTRYKAKSAMLAPRKAFFARLADLGQTRIDLVEEAQEPLKKMGFRENAYAGRCAKCRKAVEPQAGWIRREKLKNGEITTVTRCHDCAWAKLPSPSGSSSPPPPPAPHPSR